jgi:hypothetical protein
MIINIPYIIPRPIEIIKNIYINFREIFLKHEIKRIAVQMTVTNDIAPKM